MNIKRSINKRLDKIKQMFCDKKRQSPEPIKINKTTLPSTPYEKQIKELLLKK